jgi:hypothetical protein
MEKNKKNIFQFFPLFTACGREGGRAKQRPGESTLRHANLFEPLNNYYPGKF